MTDGPRHPKLPGVLPYAAPMPTGQQSMRPSAFLFAVTYYAFSVAMIYIAEVFFGAPKGEYGAASDAIIVALLIAPFAVLALITFAMTARAMPPRHRFPPSPPPKAASAGRSLRASW